MARGRNKVNATGRSKTAAFVMIWHAMTDSDAWRALNGNSVKLLVHLVRMSQGNNGHGHRDEPGKRLFLAESDAAKAIHVARETASRAFDELQEKGFLRVIEAGHFQVKTKKATVWRLTFQPTPWNHGAPTNEWRNWRREQIPRHQKFAGTALEISASDEPAPTTAPEISPVPAAARRQSPPASIGLESSHHLYVPQGGVGESDARGLPSTVAACPTPGDISLPARNDGDPEAIAHRNVAAWWSAADKVARTALADRHKLKTEEVDRYVAGSAHLPFLKATALHLACQRMTARAA